MGEMMKDTSSNPAGHNAQNMAFMHNNQTLGAQGELLLPLKTAQVVAFIESQYCWGSRFWHNPADDIEPLGQELLSGSMHDLRRHFDAYLLEHTSAAQQGGAAVCCEANVYDYVLFLHHACGISHTACDDALHVASAIASGSLTMPAAFASQTLVAMRLIDAGLQRMYSCEHPDVRPLIEPMLPLFTGESDIPAPNTPLPSSGPGLALLAILRAQLHNTSPLVRQAMCVFLKHPEGTLEHDLISALRLHGVPAEILPVARRAFLQNLKQVHNEYTVDLLTLLTQVTAIRHAQNKNPHAAPSHTQVAEQLLHLGG